jgi:predicted nucleic acid-binding protein
MYLLDTDIIIYSLKGHAAVQENLRRHRNASLCVSVISLMELYYGAYKSQRIESNLAKVKTIEKNLKTIQAGEEVVELFGMLKSKLEAKGQPTDDFDLVIASTALAHNLILITNNTRHFQKIEGLKIENWSQLE